MSWIMISVLRLSICSLCNFHIPTLNISFWDSTQIRQLGCSQLCTCTHIRWSIHLHGLGSRPRKSQSKPSINSNRHQIRNEQQNKIHPSIMSWILRCRKERLNRRINRSYRTYRQHKEDLRQLSIVTLRMGRRSTIQHDGGDKDCSDSNNEEEIAYSTESVAGIYIGVTRGHVCSANDTAD